MSIKIVTDSTCDLPESVVARWGITVVPLYINLGQKGYLDGIELSRQEFYERLPTYNPLPTTATPGRSRPPPPDRGRSGARTAARAAPRETG